MDLRGDCYWCGHQNIASRCHLELENKKGSLLEERKLERGEGSWKEERNVGKRQE